MAIEDHKDEVNPITSNDDDLQSAFEEMYLDFENFGLKNDFLKRKILSLEKELSDLKENIENVEKTKITFEKENKNLKKKNELLTYFFLKVFLYTRFLK